MGWSSNPVNYCLQEENTLCGTHSVYNRIFYTIVIFYKNFNVGQYIQHGTVQEDKICDIVALKLTSGPLDIASSPGLLSRWRGGDKRGRI